MNDSEVYFGPFKAELQALERRFDAMLTERLNAQTKTLVFTMVGTMLGGMISVAVLAFGAAKLA